METPYSNPRIPNTRDLEPDTITFPDGSEFTTATKIEDGTSSVTVEGNTPSVNFKIAGGLSAQMLSNRLVVPEVRGSISGLKLYNNAGSDGLFVTNSGRLGIGTTDPQCKLDIHGTTVGTITVDGTNGGREVAYNYSSPHFFNTTQNNMYVAINTSNGGAFVGWALYVGHSIQFNSDERIKTDIQELNDSQALETFRQLKPCKYKYKEPVLSNRTTNEVYGYIAQEVADVLPHAVTKGDIKETHQGHIPNIMSLCDISSNTITIKKSLDTSVVTEGGYLCSDVSNNIPLKTINDLEKNAEGIYHPLIFYDKNKKIYESKIIEVIDETTFIVDDLPFENENMIDENQLLLYGQKPDDFHRLNKDVIFTVTAAALQEVDRIQQKQQAEIEELKARLSALEK